MDTLDVQFDDLSSGKILSYNPLWGVHTHPTKLPNESIGVDQTKIFEENGTRYMSYEYLGVSEDELKFPYAIKKEYILNDGNIYLIDQPDRYKIDENGEKIYNIAKIIDTY